MSEKKTLIGILADIDRRIIFVLVFVALTIPLVFGMPLPLPISNNVKKYYETLESVPAGAVVGVDAELMGATYPQLGSDLTLVFVQLLRRDAKIVIWTLTVDSPPFNALAMDDALRLLGAKGATKKYGVDWVDLGYVAGTETGLASLMTSIKGTVSTDRLGNKIADLPMMKNIDTGKDFSLVVWHSGSAGSAPYGIRQINGRFRTPMLVAVTSNEYPLYFTYLEAGQIVGLIGGARGAAEHETLMNMPGLATGQTSALALGGVIILVLLLIGNVTHILRKRRTKK
jgi:hypothetical protein